MITTQQFLDACLDPETDCVEAVRRCVADDPRHAKALDHDWNAWPRDLLGVAAQRAQEAGIKPFWPSYYDVAVGFLRAGDVVSCALHIPGAGWWAKGRRGAVQVAPGNIVASYEVQLWRR